MWKILTSKLKISVREARFFTFIFPQKRRNQNIPFNNCKNINFGIRKTLEPISLRISDHKNANFNLVSAQENQVCLTENGQNI